MEQERIWVLLSRKLSGEAGNAELAELRALLERYPELNPFVHEITSVWEHSTIPDADFMQATYLLHLDRMKNKGVIFSSPEQEHENKNELSVPLIKQKTEKPHRQLLYMSLTVLLLMVAFIFYPAKNQLLKNDIGALIKNKKEITTENGTRTKMQLPDGTLIWLNAGSEVTYDKDFNGPTRDVYLNGEAYFDVAKQPSRPFTVHTMDINIKALGTAFNVRAYSSDKTVEATLLRGLIEITRRNDDKASAIFLHPNQKLTLDRSIIANPVAKNVISAYSVSKLGDENEKELPETSWMYNRLTFKGDDFETLAGKLERWYNVQIVFEDGPVKKIHFNGSLENETVDQAFAALQMASPFTYKINNNEIYVSSVSK